MSTGYYQNDKGREKLPDELPVTARGRVKADHRLDVVQEPIDAVMPWNDAHFRHSDDQGGKRGRVGVNQLQDVHSAARAHHQSEEEHNGRSGQQNPSEMSAMSFNWS